MFEVIARYVLARLQRKRAYGIACACWLAALTPSVSHAQAAAVADTAERGVVNLNAASAQELVRLPGIGPTRAAAILALRARLKRFTRVEELLRVKGIGRATFRKLRPMLALDGPTTLRERSAASGRTARAPAAAD